MMDFGDEDNRPFLKWSGYFLVTVVVISTIVIVILSVTNPG